VDNVAQFTESLRDDLAAWTKATEIPPLNKHASQVAAIVLQLTEALASLGELKDSQPVNVLEQAIGDYLHIWDFFRTKLAMRFVPWYQPLTAAADDLAWAAFGPVRAAAHDRMKRELREPPLVYYSREVIPFTVTRGQNYQNLLPRGGLWTEQSEAVADNLVVPVVSLPWQRFTSLSGSRCRMRSATSWSATLTCCRSSASGSQPPMFRNLTSPSGQHGWKRYSPTSSVP